MIVLSTRVMAVERERNQHVYKMGGSSDVQRRDERLRTRRGVGRAWRWGVA